VKVTIIGSRVRESHCQSSAEDSKGHGYLSRHLWVGTRPPLPAPFIANPHGRLVTSLVLRWTQGSGTRAAPRTHLGALFAVVRGAVSTKRRADTARLRLRYYNGRHTAREGPSHDFAADCTRLTSSRERDATTTKTRSGETRSEPTLLVLQSAYQPVDRRQRDDIIVAQTGMRGGHQPAEFQRISVERR
jgi:hypothetical protein